MPQRFCALGTTSLAPRAAIPNGEKHSSGVSLWAFRSLTEPEGAASSLHLTGSSWQVRLTALPDRLNATPVMPQHAFHSAAYVIAGRLFCSGDRQPSPSWKEQDNGLTNFKETKFETSSFKIRTPISDRATGGMVIATFRALRLISFLFRMVCMYRCSLNWFFFNSKVK